MSCSTSFIDRASDILKRLVYPCITDINSKGEKAPIGLRAGGGFFICEGGKNMKKSFLLTSVLAVVLLPSICLAGDYTMAPDGSYVSGDSYTTAPDGTYVSGDFYTMTPAGGYVGGNDYTMTPNGGYVGGSDYTMTPDGGYVGGSGYTMTPDGSYVGE